MAFLIYLKEQTLQGLFILCFGLFAWILIALLLQGLSVSFRKGLSKTFGVKFFCYLTALGTVLHELSHAFFCLIFLHKITEISLFKPQENELGHVTHTYNPANFYHRIGNFFIGTGPVWGGLAALCFISFLLLPPAMFFTTGDVRDSLITVFDTLFTNDFLCDWRSWLWLYLAFSFVSHMTLSLSDLKGARDGFILIVLIVFLATWGFGWLGNWPQYVCSAELYCLQWGVTTILIPMVTIVAVAILFLLLYLIYSVISGLIFDIFF